MTEKTYTLTMSENEAQHIAWALAQSSNEKRSRLWMHETTDQPQGTDTCCEAHLDRYHQRKREYEALHQQYVSIQALSLRAAALVDGDTSNPTDSPVLNSLHEALIERGETTAAQRLIDDPDQSWDEHIGPLLDRLA